MTILEHQPIAPLAAEVALLTSRHLRLLASVDRLSESVRTREVQSIEDVLAELDVMAAEART